MHSGSRADDWTGQDQDFGSIASLSESHRRHLEAEHKSPRTIQSYGEAVQQFSAFLVAQGMPTRVSAIHREHIEAFIVEILRRHRPSTASNRFKSLQQFFR